MKAYIEASQDRDGNIFYKASVCEGGDIVDELSGYDRDALEAGILSLYPDIEIEEA